MAKAFTQCNSSFIVFILDTTQIGHALALKYPVISKRCPQWTSWTKWHLHSCHCSRTLDTAARKLLAFSGYGPSRVPIQGFLRMGSQACGAWGNSHILNFHLFSFLRKWLLGAPFHIHPPPIHKSKLCPSPNLNNGALSQDGETYRLPNRDPWNMWTSEDWQTDASRPAVFLRPIKLKEDLRGLSINRSLHAIRNYSVYFSL